MPGVFSQYFIMKGTKFLLVGASLENSVAGWRQQDSLTERARGQQF
jgi:hypothetical protein